MYFSGSDVMIGGGVGTFDTVRVCGSFFDHHTCPKCADPSEGQAQAQALTLEITSCFRRVGTECFVVVVPPAVSPSALFHLGSMARDGACGASGACGACASGAGASGASGAAGASGAPEKLVKFLTDTAAMLIYAVKERKIFESGPPRKFTNILVVVFGEERVSASVKRVTYTEGSVLVIKDVACGSTRLLPHPAGPPAAAGAAGAADAYDAVAERLIDFVLKRGAAAGIRVHSFIAGGQAPSISALKAMPCVMADGVQDVVLVGEVDCIMEGAESYAESFSAKNPFLLDLAKPRRLDLKAFPHKITCFDPADLSGLGVVIEVVGLARDAAVRGAWYGDKRRMCWFAPVGSYRYGIRIRRPHPAHCICLSHLFLLISCVQPGQVECPRGRARRGVRPGVLARQQRRQQQHVRDVQRAQVGPPTDRQAVPRAISRRLHPRCRADRRGGQAGPVRRAVGRPVRSRRQQYRRPREPDRQGEHRVRQALEPARDGRGDVRRQDRRGQARVLPRVPGPAAGTPRVIPPPKKQHGVLVLVPVLFFLFLFLFVAGDAWRGMAWLRCLF